MPNNLAPCRKKWVNAPRYLDGAVQEGLSHCEGLPVVPGPVKPGMVIGADLLCLNAVMKTFLPKGKQQRTSITPILPRPEPIKYQHLTLKVKLYLFKYALANC